MQQQRCSEQEAFDLLRLSQQTNLKLRDVCTRSIRRALDAALSIRLPPR
ncbi:ANTAR domain-containing protein [Streptomyces sp. NPDC048419]